MDAHAFAAAAAHVHNREGRHQQRLSGLSDLCFEAVVSSNTSSLRSIQERRLDTAKSMPCFMNYKLSEHATTCRRRAYYVLSRRASNQNTVFVIRQNKLNMSRVYSPTRRRRFDYCIVHHSQRVGVAWVSRCTTFVSQQTVCDMDPNFKMYIWSITPDPTY